MASLQILQDGGVKLYWPVDADGFDGLVISASNTAEQWIKEGKYALNWTRLSCHRFVTNQVRLWLFVLAYNLGNFMRRLTLPESVKHWSLRSVQTKLIKMGGRLVRHARRLVFQLAEVAVSREVFRQVLERISGLHPPPGWRISLRPSEVKRGNQGRGACLGEFEGSANVVTATSAAHRTPVHGDAGWFCELDGKVDGIRE